MHIVNPAVIDTYFEIKIVLCSSIKNLLKELVGWLNNLFHFRFLFNSAGTLKLSIHFSCNCFFNESKIEYIYIEKQGQVQNKILLSVVGFIMTRTEVRKFPNI